MKHKKSKKSKKGRILWAASVVVLVISLLLVLMSSKVFSVREIMVVGNRNIKTEDIIALSGVIMGDNYLQITASQLKKNLERNRYIEYLGHGFDYKGTLTIRINERLGKAYVRVNGLYYIMDEKGMVLQQMGDIYPEELTGIGITGLQLSSHVALVEGQIFPVQDERKLEIMEKLIATLEETSMIGRISQINLENINNISLITSDGAKVEMGDAGSMRTKVLIAREVISIREQKGSLMGAKIDVSTGRDAHYIPATLPTPTPVPTPTGAPSPTPSST